DLGLSAELSFETDFARDGRDLVRKRCQRIDHAVDGLGEKRDFTGGLQREFTFEVAVCDAGNDLPDTAGLRREVRRHGGYGIGGVVQRGAEAGNARLTAEFSFGTDFARYAGDFRREGVELVDHDVDGIFELENLTSNVDRNFLGEVAVGYGGRDL